jgi:xyloglucan-specific exo-beta-1,4-glucanase
MRILKLFLCLIFLAAFAGPLFAQEVTYTWGNVAIGGGGFVTGIIPSTTEEGLLYARTDVGGAYRWDESNSKWIPLNDWISEDQVGYLGVESLATDPTEPNRL